MQYRDCQDDRDYRNEDASAESWLGSRLGVTDLLFAGSDRSFGANQFYGDYPSWERTKGWFASARQELGSQTVAAFGYRRHTDDFVLLRNDPAIYENNHIDGSWQGSLRRTENLCARTALLLMGLEADGDSIHSSTSQTNFFALGIHARNRGAGYVDLDLRPAKKRWSLSAGAREEIFSGGAQAVFSPELAGSFRVANSLKLRASGGYGFRIPDLHRSLLLRPVDAGQSKSEAGVGVVGRWGRGLGAVSEALAFGDGILFAAARHDRLRKRAAFRIRISPRMMRSGEYVVRGQSERPALCGCRIDVDVDSEEVANSADCSGPDCTARRARCTGSSRSMCSIIRSRIFMRSWTWALGHDFVLTNAVQLAQRYQQTVYPVWNATS